MAQEAEMAVIKHPVRVGRFLDEKHTDRNRSQIYIGASFWLKAMLDALWIRCETDPASSAVGSSLNLCPRRQRYINRAFNPHPVASDVPRLRTLRFGWFLSDKPKLQPAKQRGRRA